MPDQWSPLSAPSPPGRTALRRRQIAAAALVTVIGLVCLYTLYYWGVWHNWFWKDPTALSLCGRNYSQSTVEDAQTFRRKLYPVYLAPPLIGRQVYSDTSPAQRTLDQRRPGAACGLALVIKDAPTRYRVFTLEGGP